MSKFDVNDDRHFNNEYRDYSVENASRYILHDEISNDFKKVIARKIFELTSILDSKIQDLSSKDISVYTGLSGIAYFYYNLSNSHATELNELSKRSRATFVHLIERCLRHLRGRQGSFICDDTGPMTLAVISDIDSSKHSEILSAAEYIINSDQLPNEMLYGRSGYLFALLLLNKNDKPVSKDLIKQVFKTIIKRGRDGANLRNTNSDPPLFYEWHDKPYLGAAHGMTGVMFMLLQVYLESTLHAIHADIQNDIFEYVLPTIKFLANCRLSSGNYPSSLGDSSRRDVLVHWCHGAPGWVHMFIAAHKVFKEELFYERITEIGDVLWQRGLLHKGCGVCHGSAGSGYGLLAIYQYTQDTKYLYRALKFAEWCTDCFKNRTREADRPYSLFEGLAGTINFLVDCLNPKEAKFPAYEL